MDRNDYQSELDRVRFTEAGKSALTDALRTGGQNRNNGGAEAPG